MRTEPTTDARSAAPDLLEGASAEVPNVAPTSVARTVAMTVLWPAAAGVSLAFAVGGWNVTAGGLALLVSGIIAAYGLDRLVDCRDIDAPVLRRALAVVTTMAALATAVLACTALWRLAVCGVLAVLAGAYVPLKRFVPKNVLTVTAWTVAVTHLPFSGFETQPASFSAAVATVAFILIANTVLCDIPDIASDREARVVAITARFGARTGAIVAGSAAAAAACVAALTGFWGLTAAALCLVALAISFPSSHRVGRLKRAADSAVIFVPGPLTLLILLLS